jgi:hypothetical protein
MLRGKVLPRRKTMFKSTLLKWAVAAAMSVPAIPALGTTIHRHHRVIHRTHSLVVVKTHHRLVTRGHRHVVMTAHRKLSSHRMGSHRLVSGSSVRHSSMSSTNHFKVHPTKMPPTIDGINT